MLERQKINPFTLTKDKKLTFKLSVINLSFTKKVGGGTEVNSSKVCSLCSMEQVQSRLKRTPEQKNVQGTENCSM